MNCTLSLIAGRLTAHPHQGEPVAVRLVRATPRTAPHGAIAALDQRKREVCWWPSLAAPDPSSRALAEAELAERYHEPVINAIASIESLANAWHWTVETNAGPWRFVLRNPDQNLDQQDDGRLLVRDVFGSRYVIPQPAALDPESRRELARMW